MALPKKSKIEKILEFVEETKKSIRPPKELEENLTELEYTEKDTKIKVSKNIRSNINQPSMVTYNSPNEKKNFRK